MTNTPLTAFQRGLIGWDDFFEHFHKQLRTAETKYPPHNLIKYNDGTSVIELALAGFSENDVDIVLKDNTLVIEGKVETEERPPPGNILDGGEDESDEASPTYIYRGIARRSFRKTFQLHEHIQVVGATMRDGMLTVELKYELPEEKRPVSIPISRRDGPQVLME